MLTALELENDLVLGEKSGKPYSIVFGGNKFVGNGSSCIIPAKNRRETEILLLSLEDNACVIMDEQSRKQYPDVWDWLHKRTYREIFEELKWSYREANEVIKLIERIPLPQPLRDGFIKTSNGSLETELIDQEYVHKVNKDNVLISKPYQSGNIFYFNGFKKSSEFNIDHGSDHLEGIIIFEAARQAGIATVHLAGIPISGVITILDSITKYTKFIDSNQPYLIRTLPAIKQRGGYGFVAYQISQNGNSCATGYLTGMIYKSKESYQKFRHSKINNRDSNGKTVHLQCLT